MQITKQIHAIKIPFQIAIGPGIKVDRFVYVYLIYGKKIYLIDTGVATSEKMIFDYIRKTGRNPEDYIADRPDTFPPRPYRRFA